MKKFALSGNNPWMDVPIKLMFRVMRITLILLFACAFYSMAERATAQDARVTIRKNNVQVSQILDEIEQQADYLFIYNDQINVHRKVTVRAKNEPVSRVLSDVFNDTNVEFQLEGDHIILSVREQESEKEMTVNILSQQQGKTVTGTVVDENGEPVPGAAIMVKGTLIGTISQMDGSFTLPNVPEDATLVFSFMGMVSREVSVTGRDVLEIVLQRDTFGLDEVVVVGYGVQTKADITGSVAVINTDELLASTGSSAMQQLQGKTAGVYIGQSGSPGSPTMVRIRGINTVNDNGPLYVIDGVSTRNPNLSSLNPSDIESMQVLKDASSAAIYGAQAANGVILITTKKGTASGQPTFSYNAYYGVQKTGKRYDLLNSDDRLDIEWKSQQNSFDLRGVTGKFPSHPQFGSGPTPTIPNYLTTNGAQGSQNINPDDYSFPGNQMVPYSDTDWWDEVDRTAPMQNHQLTLAGGTDKGQYTMGLNYFNQQGTVIESYYKRYQARVNTSFDVRPWLRFGENLSYSFTKDQGLSTNAQEASPYSWVYRSSPWVPVRDIQGNYAGSGITGTGNWQNVVAMQERNKDNYWSNTRVFGNVYGELDLIPDLTFRTNFGVDYTNYYSYRMEKKNPEFSESPGTNNLEENSGFNFRWVWNNTLNYSRKFGMDHSLTVLLGSEAIKDGLGRDMLGRRFGYLFEDNEDTWELNMGENDNRRIANSSYNGEFALFGIFARADYAFRNKYLVTGIVRRDGVSRFSESNRYGTFPSMSVGWRLSEESFMQGTRSWLDDLKLRVGYGETGNSEMSRKTNYAYEFATSPSNTNYDLAGGNTSSSLGYRLNRYGNPDTKWETTKMVNIGIDATFLRGKFNTTIEYYHKKTSDMLIEAAYSALASVEVGKPYINYGDMQNNGFDMDFNYRESAGDWSWDIGLNLSAYKNKVLRLSTSDDFALWGDGDRLNNSVTRTIKGRPISEFYGYKVIGFYESEQDVLNSPLPYGADDETIAAQAASYVGKYKFADTSDDGTIGDEDRTILGSPHPDLVVGLNSTVSYKNWDFTMFWYSTIGNDLFNNTKYFTDFPLFGGNRSIRMRDQSWEKGADNSKAILPILDSQDNWGGAVPSSYYVEDGSFLRLKNLVLGYTLPKAMLQKLDISNLRFYLQAENILTITNYNGLDPELTNRDVGARDKSDLSRGIDGGGWPTTKRFLIGVNLSF